MKEDKTDETSIQVKPGEDAATEEPESEEPEGDGREDDEPEDDEPEDDEPEDDEEEEAGGDDDGGRDKTASPVTPPGNPPHWLRGILITLAGAVVPFLLMASDRHWSFSVPLGLAGCLVSTWGIFELLGSFDDPDDDRVVARVDFAKLWPRLLELLGSVVVLLVLLRLAVAGVLPMPILSAAVLIPAGFLWVVVAVYRTGKELGAFREPDENGRVRTLLERHGFWLIVLLILLYLPLLGSYSLSDPWETHYGEVSREMLARDDWISTWWAQDGWFWSKPVLDFWIQALSFSLLGVHYMPDQMLSSAGQGLWPSPEWAARMPVFILTLAGVYFIYKAMAKVFGRRAGFLGGVVLITMPYWFLISHQTMTDMPYVGPLTAAMALLILGFHTDPETRVKAYELKLGSRTLSLSGYHLLFGLIALTVLPQVLYLLSRNITLQLSHAPHGFSFHIDRFWSGSGGGNCGLPGNQACQEHLPVNRGFEPMHGALLWSVVAGILLWANRGERRLGRLYFLAAWYFMALSALAKGAPGLVLPLFAAGVYVGATRRWRDLPRLEIIGCVLLVACVALPWYVQMYMRHGQPFTDRLLFHDMYKRAFVHVHDTNIGDDTSFRYYIWQLGYGLFPWTGLGAAGLIWSMRRRNELGDPRGDAAAFLMTWFFGAFGMFTITLTKFHHYILPLVPVIAVMTGVLLDRMLAEGELPGKNKLFPYLRGLFVGMAIATYGAMRLFPGQLGGALLTGGTKPRPPSYGLGIALLLIGLAIAVMAVLRHGKTDVPAIGSRFGRYRNLTFAAVGLASAVVVALSGRDLFMSARGDVEGQARLMQLFTYNYRRPWPESLDFKAILTAFTLVSAVPMALLVVRRWRVHVLSALLGVSVLWAAWGIDVYLYKCAPHWGQRGNLLAYYKDRSGPDEPFVAFQMNWKGENFYSGNHVPAFVSSGRPFKDWVQAQKDKGVKVMYFTTEHGRIGSLKGELGNPKDFTVITTKEQNNKFFVARVRF